MTPFPPGQDPLPIWVCQTYLTFGNSVGYRSFGFTDQAAAEAYGKQFVAQKPAEATSASYKVVPLEAP